MRTAVALALGHMLLLPSMHATAAVSLSTLDGSNGFRLDGARPEDSSGAWVSKAGDINGDGIDDLIIGAFGTDPSGSYSGSSYVVFGRSTDFAPVLELSALDGSNGFRMDGSGELEFSGESVAGVGDINGDGIDDLIIGARGADHACERCGSSYVVFGRSTGGFAPTIRLSELDGNDGFRLDGVAERDHSGTGVSGAGDVNADGINDLLIGAPSADPDGRDSAGSCYVVFGRMTGFAPVINLSELDGSTGFRLDGAAAGDVIGSRSRVAGIGDFNGDGVDDLIIGAPGAEVEGRTGAGSSYVVFGRSTGGFPAVIQLSTLDGSNGVRFDGVAAEDQSGTVSAAGDINGDGVDDVVIGARFADPNGSYSGSSYVVFGRSTGFAPVIELSGLDGSTGFRLDGAAAVDVSGARVTGIGDFNADGVDDLIVGAPGADVEGRANAGSSYLVFGRSTGSFPPVIELSSVDGSSGIRFDGVAAEDQSAAVSAAGDVNDDGIDDLIIGAPAADPNGQSSGSSYVVFGHRQAPEATNYSYTYWDPSEPGWGYNLSHQGDLLYGTWYSYAADGKPMFLTVEALLNSDGSFSGPIYRVSGTPFQLINGTQAFTGVTEVGVASMVFDTDGTLILQYTYEGSSQVKALERFAFDPDAPQCFGTTESRATADNYSDLWWNASEAGWGLTLSHQGDVIFLLWYTYGEEGRDQWISGSTLRRQPDGRYLGALQRPVSGTPLLLIDGPATTFPVTEVGSAELSFSDGENGQFTYSLDGVTQAKTITRFVAVGPGELKPLCD
ncbi:MAG: integrin alpha [Lysobacterales bacterium]